MRPSLAVALMAIGMMCGAEQGYAQDAAGGGRQQLDRVLAVLRLHQNAASKSCLTAMNAVHQDEDQVTELGRNGSGTSDKPNPSLDIARDVLGSDYDTATAACAPDAAAACRAPAAAATPPCEGLNPPAG